MNQQSKQKDNSIFSKSSQLTPKYLSKKDKIESQEEHFNNFISRFGMMMVDGKMMMSKFACFSIDHL